MSPYILTRLLLILTIIPVVSGCATRGGGIGGRHSFNSGSYFPIADDAVYSYQFSFKKNSGIHTIRTSRRTVGGGAALYAVDEAKRDDQNALISPNLPGLGIIRIGPEGLETAACNWKEGLSGVRSSDFQLMIRLPVSVGDTASLVDYDGGDFKKKVTVLGFEDVTVPAGNFEKSARIQISTDWAEGKHYKETFWLARGVGVVKWVRATGRVEELVSFRTSTQ